MRYRVQGIAFLAVLLSGCSSPTDQCIDALNESYPYLQVDQTRTDLQEKDGIVEGDAVFRRKGSTDYLIKSVSCPVQDGKVRRASCPGCP